MQEWLKDRKNLPIVVALAVFVLLGAGGLVALELGAFSPRQAADTAATQPQQGIPGGPPVGAGGPPPGSSGPPPGAGGPPPNAGRPGMPRGGMPRGGMPRGSSPATSAAATPVAPKSDIVNPLLGPDPFQIPGGAKKYAQTAAKMALPKPELRNVIGPLDLFRIHPPTPPETSSNFPNAQGASPANLAANYRLSGLINGPDGNNAILEVGGQSQSVKPGDTLADGTSVQSIQSTSVTLRSAGGSVFILPISAGTPDQGAASFNGQPQYPGGFNGQPPYPGGFNGQPQVN